MLCSPGLQERFQNADMSAKGDALIKLFSKVCRLALALPSACCGVTYVQCMDMDWQGDDFAGTMKALGKK